MRDGTSSDNSSLEALLPSNRRSFLSRAIGGFGATLGLQGLVARVQAGGKPTDGPTVTETAPKFDEMIDAAEVRSLLDELDLDPQRDEAEGFRVSVNETEIDVTTVPTRHGELVYMHADDGTTDATLFFDASSKYPRTHYDAPPGVTGSLVGRRDGTVYVREASRAERRKLAKTVGADPSKIVAYTGSHLNGYEVVVPNEQTETLRKYAVQGHAHKATEAELSVVESGEVGTQGVCDAAGLFCYLCVTGAPICGACASLCLSGVGSLACVICLVHTCGITASDCYTCIDCLT